jgi:hypothetical protein
MKYAAITFAAAVTAALITQTPAIAGDPHHDHNPDGLRDAMCNKTTILVGVASRANLLCTMVSDVMRTAMNAMEQACEYRKYRKSWTPAQAAQLSKQGVDVVDSLIMDLGQPKACAYVVEVIGGYFGPEQE